MRFLTEGAGADRVRTLAILQAAATTAGSWQRRFHTRRRPRQNQAGSLAATKRAPCSIPRTNTPAIMHIRRRELNPREEGKPAAPTSQTSLGSHAMINSFVDLSTLFALGGVASVATGVGRPDLGTNGRSERQRIRFVCPDVVRWKMKHPIPGSELR